MAKLTLAPVTSGFQSVDVLNANFEAIEDAIENTVSRDGSAPNQMGAELDMNNNRITNIRGAADAADVPSWGQVQALAYNYSIQRVVEKQTQPFQTVYSTTPEQYVPNENNIAVYLDGVRLTSTQYTETDNQTITLASNPGGIKSLVFVIAERLGSFGDIPAHYHIPSDITGLDVWTGLDDRYYTETEVDNALALKASLIGAAFTGNISTTGTFSRKNADSSTLTAQPRVFVQSGDPGAAAADGDLWIW